MVNSLKLPKAIGWYVIEEGQSTELRNTLESMDVKINSNSLEEELFEPEIGARIIE